MPCNQPAHPKQNQSVLNIAGKTVMKPPEHRQLQTKQSAVNSEDIQKTGCAYIPVMGPEEYAGRHNPFNEGRIIYHKHQELL